jgi:glutathione S-transferase
MKLYWSPQSCAMAAHIVLEWVGADYEAEQVKPGSDEFKAINPLGSVPALIDGDSGVMNQVDAILQYLAEKFPEAKLGPNDTVRDRYEMHRWLAYLTGDFHPAFYPFFRTQRYTTGTDEQSLQAVKAAACERIDFVVQVLENHVQGAHIVEDRRTIVDPYAFAMLRWVNALPKKLDAYPNLHRFQEQMLQDAAVQRVLAVHGVKR